MPITISSQDIAQFIRLRKTKAELSFKKEYLAANNAANDAILSLDKELKTASDQLAGLESRFAQAKVVIVLPDDRKMEELNTKISASDHKAITEALKTKSGPLYELLAERGKLLKRNADMVGEIGKLNVLLHKLDRKNRNEVETFVRNGGKDRFELKVQDEKMRARLSRILVRLGMNVQMPKTAGKSEENREIELIVDNKKVWVPEASVDEVKANSGKIEELNKKIQIANAERQIKKFSEEEEKQFAKMQTEYLELLKERDKLLKNHLEEIGETITVNA